MIQYSTQEASPEQVSSPGGVYISPRELVYSTLGAEGAQVVHPSSRWEMCTPPGPETCSGEASQVLYCILPVSYLLSGDGVYAIGSSGRLPRAARRRGDPHGRPGLTSNCDRSHTHTYPSKRVSHSHLTPWSPPLVIHSIVMTHPASGSLRFAGGWENLLDTMPNLLGG